MEEPNRTYKPVEFGWLVALTTGDRNAATRVHRPRRHVSPFALLR